MTLPLAAAAPREKRVLPVALIAAILYFSEGLPYGFITELLPLYLRTHGIELARIGLLSTIGLAWTLKLFWSPLVDRFGTYRSWVTGAVVALTLCWAVFAIAAPVAGPLFWITAAVMAIASATHDIGADALTIRVTPASMLGPVNSIRVTAYRVAIILAGGGLAALAGARGWRVSFAAGALASMIILVFVTRLPPDRTAVPATEPLFAGVRAWLARSDAGWLLALVLLYRLGDAALTPMVKPFWVDHGYSPGEIGTVTTVAGMALTIAGAIAGGAFITRRGLWAGLLWLGILQMLSNGGYAWIATFGGARPSFYAAAFIENFTGGLGTAAFLAFLMAVCEKEHAATEYALLSALFGLTRSLIGSASGVAAQSFGYSAYFWLTLALGIPGLLLLPRLRARLDDGGSGGGSGVSPDTRAGSARASS